MLPRARAPTSSSGAMTSTRRWRYASSTRAIRSAPRSCWASLYSHLGPAATRSGPAFRRFLLETGADDELVGSHMTRAEATGAIVDSPLSSRTSPRRSSFDASLGRLRQDLPAGFGGLEQAGARRLAGAPYSARAIPACGAGRPGPRSPTGSRAAFPFLDHRVFRVCRRRSPPGTSSTGMRRQGGAARSLPSDCCRRASSSAPSSHTVPRRWPRFRRRGARLG